MNKRAKKVGSQSSDVTLQRFPIRKSELDRFKFGRASYREIARSKTNGSPYCLDIACGAKPFPEANVLCDLHVEPVSDRSMKNLVTEDKPFVLCSCYALPFKDKAFDFVTSYYLIEHVNDPWALFKELKRVSSHGYVQCPSKAFFLYFY
jgi:SAM-dependent methyltransferase